MRKVKKNDLLKNCKTMVAFLMGIIVSASTAYVTTTKALTEKGYAIESSNVEYQDNASLGVTNVQAAIDGTCTKFSEQLTELRESMYPIGSIYLSTNLSTASAVESMLGGTWEAYGKGKTLVGVDTEKEQYNSSNKEGGNNSVTLSASQIPSLSVSGTTGTGSITSSGTHTHTTTSSTTDIDLITQEAGQHNHYVRYGGNGITIRETGKGTGSYSGWHITNYTSTVWNVDESTFSLNTNYNGLHSHSVTGTVNIPALSISSSGAHTHTIPSLSVNAKYTNSNVSSINVQDEYITVYMYKRTA